MGRAEIAFLLDVEERTITNYVKQDVGFPSRVNGRARTFPVKRCLKWNLDHAIADAVAAAKSASATTMGKDGEKSATPAMTTSTRKQLLEIELLEIDVAKARREVVDVAAAATEFRELCTRMRDGVLSKRGEYRSQLLNLETLGEADAVLARLIDAILVVLGRAVDGMDAIELETDDEPDPSAVDPPAESPAADAPAAGAPA